MVRRTTTRLRRAWRTKEKQKRNAAENQLRADGARIASALMMPAQIANIAPRVKASAYPAANAVDTAAPSPNMRSVSAAARLASTDNPSVPPSVYETLTSPEAAPVSPGAV